MPRILAVVLQLVGIVVCAAGVWMQWPWLGVALLGLGMLAVGVQLERESADVPEAG